MSEGRGRRWGSMHLALGMEIWVWILRDGSVEFVLV